jgi:hypothetical protein
MGHGHCAHPLTRWAHPSPLVLPSSPMGDVTSPLPGHRVGVSLTRPTVGDVGSPSPGAWAHTLLDTQTGYIPARPDEDVDM